MLLIIVGAAVGSLFLYTRINSEVEKHVLAELKKRHPNLDVQIGSAQIVENKGISIRNVELSVPQFFGRSRKLLHVKELFVECPVTLPTLYNKNPKISRIVVKEPILRVSRSATGKFPELPLLWEQDALAESVSVEIENGTLLYDDARQSAWAAAAPLRLTNINLTVTPEIQEQTGRLLFKGSADGDFFRRLLIDAELLPETWQWQFTAKCLHFDWSDELRQYLPPHPYVKELPLFQGRFDLNVSAVSDSAADWGCRFALAGTLAHGRIDFPTINRTISELSTRFEITNERVVIDKLTGTGDFARLSASYEQDGLMFFGDPRQHAELTVDLRDCRFDEELIAALSPFLSTETERLLAQFDYAGTTDLYAQLSCRAGVWRPKNVSMQISEIAFAHHAFPYRLDRLSGTLLIDETESLHLHFKSKQDNPVKAVIDGRYRNIFEDATGKVEITGENVPIDPKLIQALPLSVQKVVHSLNPAGKLHARLILELPPGDAPLEKQIDIALDHVSLRYDHFPYPLRDVTGLLTCVGETWQFHEVTGTNGTASVKGSGGLRPVGSIYANAQEFVLNISAEELPIDDQMAQALLNPDQRQLLQSLNISGKINLVAAQIKYLTDDGRLHLHFQAEPRPGLSIFPNRFPYRIENVEGTIYYDNGRVFSQNLSGTHRDTRLQSGLDCQFQADGQSFLRLTPLAIDQLQADRELLDALPTHLQDFLGSMQLTKPFNLSGGFEYWQTAQGEQVARWDLNWILCQNGAKLGVPVEHIFGKVRLTGDSTAHQLRLNGELNIDSLMVNGFQTTSIHGPFHYDGKQLRLGSLANPLTPGGMTRPLTGKFCDGTIQAVGLVVWDNGISYNIDGELVGANLEKIAQVIEPTAKKTAGILNCIDVNLRGHGARWETVAGTGTIQLREANIYGAPVMVRLLRELRIRETDPNAGLFSTADIDFRFSGPQMLLESVVFEGGAIFLRGDGMMRLDGNRPVDLTMKTRLGNRRMQIPVISDLIGGVGDQLVQMKITGPFADPMVTRVVLPEIQSGLQQIQPDDDILPPPAASQDRLAPSKMFRWNPF